MSLFVLRRGSTFGVSRLLLVGGVGQGAARRGDRQEHPAAAAAAAGSRKPESRGSRAKTRRPTSPFETANRQSNTTSPVYNPTS